MLLLFVTFSRRRRRELDVANVDGTAREDLLRVVNPVHMNLKALLASKLLRTQLKMKYL
jgi:hypothetical protein